MDVGLVSCLTPQGEPVMRYFINIASFGISGSIARRVGRARIAKFFGGGFAFGFHSALALLSWRECRVRLMAPEPGGAGRYDEIAGISTVAVANGQYFGGGMKVAPNALPNDGLFDVVVVGGTHKGRLLKDMKAIHSGAHLDNPAVGWCAPAGSPRCRPSRPMARSPSRPMAKAPACCPRHSISCTMRSVCGCDFGATFPPQ